MDQEGYEAPPFPADIAPAVHARAGGTHEGHEVHCLPTDDAAAEHVRACSPRVRSGLPPREDHTSNPVGPVRDIIGLVGRRRLIQAVRHIGRK